MSTQKTALIIGGSGGIGSVIVKRLLEDGFVVCAMYAKGVEKVETLRRELDGKPISFYQLDFLDEHAPPRVMQQITSDHPRIDVVVFGSTLSTPHTTLLQSQWSDFAAHHAVQVRGMWQVVNGLKAQIQAARKIKFIVILTEYCIGKPPGGIGPYVTAKYALMGFAKTMAVEFARFQCTVNMVSPGMVETDLLKTVPPKFIEMNAAQNPLKRIATPDDVANVVVFLASDQSDYLNGANITINGGSAMI